MRLVDFYEKNADQLEYAREKMEIEGLLYPQMKMIDMGFLADWFLICTQIRQYRMPTEG